MKLFAAHPLIAMYVIGLPQPVAARAARPTPVMKPADADEVAIYNQLIDLSKA